MNHYEELLKEEKSNFERKGDYYERIAGDVSTFRYPHLKKVCRNFDYDPTRKMFFLTRDINQTIERIAVNEITVYELLNPLAKKQHLCDFFGYVPTEEEKYNIFQAVRTDYQKNKKTGKWNLEAQIQEIRISELAIRDEFSDLNNFIQKARDCVVYVCKWKDVATMFQFGSTLKGTNIVFVDDSRANFCQEIFHSIYHIEEGIPGVNHDNDHIKEIWGNVDALYLKQITEGRMARRIRSNQSPHDIKFLDYVFLRAYIGQAFLEKDEIALFHSAYTLIEPTINLLVDSLEGEQKEKNKQLIAGICYDKTDSIKNSFNQKYGNGSYEKVFYDFNLFHRIKTIWQICVSQKIPYEEVLHVMFDKQTLLPTILDRKVAKIIWLHPELHQNKELILDLIEDYSEEMRRGHSIITVKKWMEHVKERFGMKQYETMQAILKEKGE